MASRYIRAGATGSNNGSSWANAWTSFASVSWTRGDTYYIAGGAYSGNVSITTAANGTLRITVKKANATDNSGDAGWDASYATSQAQIAGTVNLENGYHTWDGVTGSGTSGHGIRVTAVLASTQLFACESGTNDYDISHIEILGAGFAAGATAQDGFYLNSSASKLIRIAYCWIHEVTRNGVTLGGLVGTSFSDYGFLFEYNVVSETGGCTDPDIHGQGIQISFNASDRYTLIRNCIFRNTVGSAAIAFLGGASANHQDARIYNNLFYITDLSTYITMSPGVIWSHVDFALVNVEIMNNSFYGLGSASVTGARGRVVLETVGSGCVLYNSVFEACYFPAAHSGPTQSNNGYYNNSGSTVPSGTPNQVNGASTTYNNVAGEDFTVKTGGYAIDVGTDLSSIFTTDYTGATRSGTWDIGAYDATAGAAGASTHIMRLTGISRIVGAMKLSLLALLFRLLV